MLSRAPNVSLSHALPAVCAVRSGWRHVWDDLDDHAELRAQAEATERYPVVTAERLGVVWQREIARESIRKRRGRRG